VASTTTSALATKADASTTTSALATKADASATTSALALKADAAATTTSLGLKQDATPTGSVNFNSQKGINLGTPTASTDAATKAYVDALAQGLSAKSAVVAATTANITLSGAQTIDGVAVVATNRVLVKNQTTTSQNGIYVAAAGAWARATDMDTWAETQGAYTLVTGGSVNLNTGWVSQTAAGGTLDTTAITFAQFNSASAVSSVLGRTGAVVAQAGDYSVAQVTGAAPLAAPALTGVPTAPTAAAATNTTQLATTAFATGAVSTEATARAAADALLAPLASPVLTGVPAAPTATAGTSTTQLATTAFVAGAVGGGVTAAQATAGQAGTPATALTATQAQIGTTVTITPRSTLSKVLLVARLDLTHSATATAFTATARMWRGAVGTGVQVGQDGVLTTPTASILSPVVIVGVDSPATTAAVSYRLSAAAGATAQYTAARYEIQAIELLWGGFDQTTPVDWTSGATGNVARSALAKLAERPSVRDFGAKGIGVAGAGAAAAGYQGTITAFTDATHVTCSPTFGTNLSAVSKAVDYGTDDSAAIEFAIGFVGRFVTAYPSLKGGPTLYWPEGDYRVTRAVLSYRPDSALKGPIKHLGDGPATSRILLDPPTATTTWLYDSLTASGASGVTPKYTQLEFDSLGFCSMGPFASSANGFRYASNGHEKAFRWKNCYVAEDGNPIAIWLYACGVNANADQTMHFDCRFRNVTGAILQLNNRQSIGHDFYGCQALGIQCDVVRVLDGTNGEGDGAGGKVRWVGGCINYDTANPGTPKYILNLAGSTNLYSGFEFSPAQCELYTTNHRIMVKTTLNGYAWVTFRGVPFDGASVSIANHLTVDVDENVTVTFDDCSFRVDQQFNLRNGNTIHGYQDNEAGTIVFRRCRIPHQLPTTNLFIQGGAPVGDVNKYGSFVAEGCVVSNYSAFVTAYGSYNHGFGDWFIGNDTGGSAKSRQPKYVMLYNGATAWPLTTAGNPATCGAVLPPYATVIGVDIYKPAQATDATVCTISVKSNDGTMTVGTTASARWDALHTLHSSLTPDLWKHLDNTISKMLMLAIPSTTVTGSIFGGDVRLCYL
jgi:hypothetical protein